MSNDLEPEDVAMIARFAPPGAVPSTIGVVCTWLDPKTADEHWCLYWAGNVDLTRLVGFLELAKVDAMARCSRGKMFTGPDDGD